MRSPSTFAAVLACTGAFACGAAAADVYKSTDGGETWSFAGVADTDITDLLLRPDDADALVARSGARLFESKDAGATWQRLDDGSLRPFLIGNAGATGRRTSLLKSMLIDRGSPSVMYAFGHSEDEAGASGEGTGLMRSDDGGRSWAPLYGLPMPVVHCIEQNADLRRVFVCGKPLKETFRPARVFVTADGGDSWELVGCCSRGGDSEAWVLRADPHDSLVMYAGLQGDATPGGDGLFFSIDGGSTWEAASGLWKDPSRGEFRLPPVHAIEVDPQNTSNVYARTGYGISKSVDQGRNWRFVGFGARRLAIDPSNPSVLHASHGPEADTQYWRSTDGGATWAPHGSGLEGLDITAIVVDPRDSSVVYVATAAVAGNAAPDDGAEDPVSPDDGDENDDGDTGNGDDGNSDSDSDSDTDTGSGTGPDAGAAAETGADDDDDNGGAGDSSAPAGADPSAMPTAAPAAGGGGHAGGAFLALFGWLPALIRRRIAQLDVGLRRTIST